MRKRVTSGRTELFVSTPFLSLDSVARVCCLGNCFLFSGGITGTLVGGFERCEGSSRTSTREHAGFALRRRYPSDFDGLIMRFGFSFFVCSYYRKLIMAAQKPRVHTVFLVMALHIARLNSSAPLSPVLRIN